MFATSGFHLQLRSLKHSKIVSEAILEAYASSNSTSGTIRARFGPQNGSQNEAQNQSKIDLDGYPRPKPSPKPIFEASETSPGPFSSSPRSRFFILSSQTKKLSELLTSYYGRHRVDYKVGRLCHHCALLCAYLLGCFRSDKHICVTNFNVDTSESFSSTLLVWVD